MKKRKIKLILIIIFLIILLIFYILNKIQKTNFSDDIIFFKLFNQNKITEETFQSNKYIFDLSDESQKTKKIDLLQHVDKTTLINEKIAPGTRGEFEIAINLNKNAKCQIEFISKTKKPKNLLFAVKNDKNIYCNLEELKTKVEELVNNQKVKCICIEWMWQYEKSEKQNVQDTKDGKDIEKYNFEIYVKENKV